MLPPPPAKVNASVDLQNKTKAFTASSAALQRIRNGLESHRAKVAEFEAKLEEGTRAFEEAQRLQQEAPKAFDKEDADKAAAAAHIAYSRSMDCLFGPAHGRPLLLDPQVVHELGRTLGFRSSPSWPMSTTCKRS